MMIRGGWGTYSRTTDLDVVAGADGALYWFENAVGDASSWTRNQVSANTNHLSLFVADLDRDGDTDVASSSPIFDSIDWYENRGGQFALATVDTAPATLVGGASDDVFRIDVTHLGLAGESDLEVASVELRFEDAVGAPLSTSEATDLIAKIQLWADFGTPGSFDPASDILVVELNSFSLAPDGSLSILVPDGNPNVQLGPGMTGTGFVVLEGAIEGSSATPNQFTVTHVTESSTQAEDAANDIPLALEYTPDVTGKLITLPEAGAIPMLIAGIVFLAVVGRRRAGGA